jgi:hypothetical protein
MNFGSTLHLNESSKVHAMWLLEDVFLKTPVLPWFSFFLLMIRWRSVDRCSPSLKKSSTFSQTLPVPAMSRDEDRGGASKQGEVHGYGKNNNSAENCPFFLLNLLRQK